MKWFRFDPVLEVATLSLSEQRRILRRCSVKAWRQRRCRVVYFGSVLGGTAVLLLGVWWLNSGAATWLWGSVAAAGAAIVMSGQHAHLFMTDRLMRSYVRAEFPHACRHCGYDLRETPQRCPECGHARNASAEPPATASD